MPAKEILEFWFGPLKEGFTAENRGKLWYAGGPTVDKEIKENFGVVVQAAAARKLDSWKQTPEGRLALIILLDQFTRNVYRKTKEAFAYDPYAQQLCKEGLKLDHDNALQYIQRLFFYHPLEHSELLEDQELCIQLFQAVQDEVPDAQKDRVKGFVDYAKQHRDIIKKFGRFPHRNDALGRTATKEEIAYLAKGQRFGQ